MHLVALIGLVLSICTVSLSATIEGKLDLSPFNITRRSVINTNFKLLQVGDLTGEPYVAATKIYDNHGNFKFQDVPEPRDGNSTTFFVLQSSSLDFNLKPNRILFRIDRSSPSNHTVEVKAYKNVFGKENFASPEITHPETLEEIGAKPFVSVSLVNKAPLRVYIQERNGSLLKSGAIANILNSKFKLAAAITAVFVLIAPSIIDKLDSAAVNTFLDDKLLQPQVQKQADQQEVKSELQQLDAKS
ncbi:LADA_0H03708g1_1 [Lachancea dasiensis]|uniref:Protein SOP4 n=1 Tax=Lachancea dasiensis TaxID=1072105 RepID=A0A1G4K0B7_9SACH|nr:LADA_0H03708g1_1 [Lachancea dasiensis]